MDNSEKTWVDDNDEKSLLVIEICDLILKVKKMITINKNILLKQDINSLKNLYIYTINIIKFG